MFFSIKKLAPTQKYGVIDIWTYKIKVAIIEIIWKEINVLWYAEKRQEECDIVQSEISNIEGICNSIDIALKKACKEAWSEVEKLIINLATSTVIPEINTVSYKRTTKNLAINMKELDTIVSKIESYSIDKAKASIFKETWYQDVDIKLITSSIAKMSIDGQSVTNPIGFTWEDVVFKILNVFTPLSKYNTIKTIGKFLGKEIEYIIPNEIAIPKIIEKTTYVNSDVLFLDFGNTRTRVIVQKSGSIEWFQIVEIGLNNLIQKLREKTKRTKTQIICDLNDGKYKDEISEFLNIWKTWIHFAIEEISGTNESPSKIYLTGGWNVQFVKDFIKENFKNELKMSWEINFITDEVEIQLPEILENNSIKILPHIKRKMKKSITSMLIATKDIINLKDDVVIDIVKEVLKKIKL